MLDKEDLWKNIMFKAFLALEIDRRFLKLPRYTAITIQMCNRLCTSIIRIAVNSMLTRRFPIIKQGRGCCNTTIADILVMTLCSIRSHHIVIGIETDMPIWSAVLWCAKYIFMMFNNSQSSNTMLIKTQYTIKPIAEPQWRIAKCDKVLYNIAANVLHEKTR